MYNVLEEPVIGIVSSDGLPCEASLTELYAALMADKVDSFPALRPHQRHAWHAFLVQMGAMAMHKDELTEPPTDSDEWHRIILALTKDEFPDDEPWHLVVEDITRPAFMQPPASSDTKTKEYKNEVATPDGLDVLVTSKNHDLKAATAFEADLDDWIFALITLQTMQGFSGNKNYGISRMNSGMGSRPAFGITPSERFGEHVKRDIVVLLEQRHKLVEKFQLPEEGCCLMWTIPWDGMPTEALLLNGMDPFYLEICRRTRICTDTADNLYAIVAPSNAARMETKAQKGIMGDPWTPINRKEAKSLTLAVGGFTYRRISEYLFFGDWERPVLSIPTAAEIRSEETMTLLARGMVRGRGKTEGYYERAIPIRKKLGGAWQGRGGTDDIGLIASERLDEILRIQRILRDAIQMFLARGDSENSTPEHRNLARPWLIRLDQVIDTRFFQDLQDEFEADNPEDRERIRHQWLLNGEDGVVDNARNILSEATESLPCPSIYRFKARSRAEGLFEGRIRGNSGLPSLFQDHERNAQE